MTEDHPRLAAVYDELNSGSSDTDFYASRLGSRPLRIADVGCGTGSFAVRLSRLGHQVVGVDPSLQMLDVAQHRDGQQAVNWLLGTAPDLPAGPFDAAVMIGHAFQNLLTDDAVLETLIAVRDRLVPGGRFMFESRNPEARAWLGWDTPEDSPLVTESATAGRIEERYRVHGVVGDLVDFGCTTTFVADGLEIRERATLRFLPADRLAGLLTAAGFGRTEWFGDWDGKAFEPSDSQEIILIAHNS